MTGVKPSRNHLAEASVLAIGLRADVEVLDSIIRRGAEAGEQVAAAESLAERARALVRAATAVGRAAARRPAYAGGPPLTGAAIGDLRRLVRQRVADDLRRDRTEA